MPKLNLSFTTSSRKRTKTERKRNFANTWRKLTPKPPKPTVKRRNLRSLKNAYACATAQPASSPKISSASKTWMTKTHVTPTTKPFRTEMHFYTRLNRLPPMIKTNLLKTCPISAARTHRLKGRPSVKSEKSWTQQVRNREAKAPKMIATTARLKWTSAASRANLRPRSKRDL